MIDGTGLVLAPGAIDAGLSSGLEYDVGSYASTEEVVSMARVAARSNGPGRC